MGWGVGTRTYPRRQVPTPPYPPYVKGRSLYPSADTGGEDTPTPEPKGLLGAGRPLLHWSLLRKPSGVVVAGVRRRQGPYPDRGLQGGAGDDPGPQGLRPGPMLPRWFQTCLHEGSP